MFGVTATLILGFICYRDLAGISATESVGARIDVTNVVPLPAESDKGTGLFVNVFYANHGTLPVKQMVHRCVVECSEKPLTAAQENALMATADALLFPKNLPGTVEIGPGDYPKRYFSCQQSDEEIISSGRAIDALRTKHRLYIAIVLKYQDDRMPQDKVIVTEFCGGFNGTFDMWHNCGRNRILVQPL